MAQLSDLAADLTADLTYGALTREGCLVQTDVVSGEVEHVRAFALYTLGEQPPPGPVVWLFRYRGIPVARAKGVGGGIVTALDGLLVRWAFLTIAEDWNARMRYCAHWVALSRQQRERERALFVLEYGAPLPPFQDLIPPRSYESDSGLVSPAWGVGGGGLHFRHPLK